MKFSLNTTIIKPENNEEVKSAVILLHGYGGDGKDISMLTLNWKRFLKNTVFLCPDAHEVCSINPTGFQWFDLNNEDPEYTLQESKGAENVLNGYISNKTNILMIHGENDPIVPPTHLLEAEDFFIRNKIKIETLMIKNCDHHIPMEASSAALNFIKKNIIN